jgi:hypothetical protein
MGKVSYRLHDQFTGHCHDPTVILEAVASHDLWIWHAYFGMPESCNDINVLRRSPLFARLATGEAPAVNFEVNGHQYNMGYIWLMVSILNGRLSWRQSPNLEVTKEFTLHKLKNLKGRMLRELLGYYKLGGELFEDLLDSGIRNSVVHHDNMHHNAQYDPRGWARSGCRLHLWDN